MNVMVAIARQVKPARNDEASVQHEIRLRLGKEPDLLLFRNALSMGERWNPKTGQTARFMGGLGTGSADLVGILRLTGVSPPLGQFIAFECKRARGGRLSEEQKQWIALVRKFGGAAFVVTSVDEALAALERARRGEVE